MTGLDFRRDSQGALKLFLTQPIANYFSMEMPGAVRREGDQVLLDEAALSLRLEGERLEGTFPGPNSKASFQRVSELPAAAPIPDVPAGPGPAWQTRLNGQIFASPVVFDGKVYLGTTGGVLNAVDARTGQILWAFAAGRPILGTALVTADAVFFTCDNGYLFRLRREDGKEVWRYDLGDSRDRARGRPRALAHRRLRLDVRHAASRGGPDLRGRGGRLSVLHSARRELFAARPRDGQAAAPFPAARGPRGPISGALQARPPWPAIGWSSRRSRAG